MTGPNTGANTGPVTISADLQAWLDALSCDEGSVVHTYDGPTDITATKTAHGWTCQVTEPRTTDPGN